MSDLAYWLALNSLPDIGPVLARRLLSACGAPENIFRMSAAVLKNIEGIGESRARSIINFRQWDRIHKEINDAADKKAALVTIGDRAYPEALKNIPDAPLVLYVRGCLSDDDRYAVAVVGSRFPTDYGLRVAEQIGYRMASFGVTVVSGMARGIDTASHRGALKAGGRTIAVLGSGIDVPYPPENRKLMGAIGSSGAVISEFRLGTKPDRENFPRRNRIISALSLGVAVIEAAVDSGSLITVGYALEQGKEVFAVPGNITSKNSRGTNNLIKKGARLVGSAEDIIEELAPQIKGFLAERKAADEQTPTPMTEEEKKLCGFLDSEAKHIDAIVRESGLTGGRVMSILLNLELKGVVRQLEGKRFSVI